MTVKQFRQFVSDLELAVRVIPHAQTMLDLRPRNFLSIDNTRKYMILSKLKKRTKSIHIYV